MVLLVHFCSVSIFLFDFIFHFMYLVVELLIKFYHNYLYYYCHYYYYCYYCCYYYYVIIIIIIIVIIVVVVKAKQKIMCVSGYRPSLNLGQRP